jgi:hypothetical protein
MTYTAAAGHEDRQPTDPLHPPKVPTLNISPISRMILEVTCRMTGSENSLRKASTVESQNEGSLEVWHQVFGRFVTGIAQVTGRIVTHHPRA